MLTPLTHDVHGSCLLQRFLCVTADCVTSASPFVMCGLLAVDGTDGTDRHDYPVPVLQGLEQWVK